MNKFELSMFAIFLASFFLAPILVFGGAIEIQYGDKSKGGKLFLIGVFLCAVIIGQMIALLVWG